MNCTPFNWSRDYHEVRNHFRRIIERCIPNKANSIEEALHFAEGIHRRQKRKGDGGPYIIHPLRVAISLIEELGFGEDPHLVDLVEAALLHDCLEDGPCKADALRGFGEKVVDLVQALTRRPGEKRGPEGDQPDSPYLERIRQAGEHAVALKLADKIDNMRDAVWHPVLEKRRVYVRETMDVYLPLARGLSNMKLAATIVKQLRGAIDSHLGDPEILGDPAVRATVLREFALPPESDSYFDSLGTGTQRVLFAEFSAWAHRPVGEPFVPSFCLRNVQQGLVHYHLQNPALTVWLSWDGVQVVPTRPLPSQLAANVARKFLELLQVGKAEFILRLACLPTAFAPAEGQQRPDQMRQHWTRVERQLEAFLQLVTSEQPPEWLTPTMTPEALPCVLLALHSLAFGPLRWSFPPWQTDLALMEAEQLGNRYAHTSAPVEQLKQWQRILKFLLLHRTAFWHCWLGSGTSQRVANVLDAANDLPFERRALLSVRLMCEYLEVVAENSDPQGSDSTFEQIWKGIDGKVLGAADFLRSEYGQKPQSIELRGFWQVKDLFDQAKLSSEFSALRDILERETMQSQDVFRWIDFDTEEFRKRWKEVAMGVKGLTRKVPVDQLEEHAVLVSREHTTDSIVLRVCPSRSFALRNRLPETSQTELKTIAEQHFSAVSIFDTLLRKKLTRDGQGPVVWIPRVYRVLDSMADLDPEHAQKIRVSFSSSQSVPEFAAWLPIPHESEADSVAQNKRKQILARYLAIEIYNYAVVRRVFGARFECDEVTDPTPAVAFTNEELQGLIQEAELAYGQRKAYRAYLESFNFESFTIIAGERPETETAAFTSDIMKDPQCTFLGIDIGGTDVKFCLIREGRVVSAPEVLHRPLDRFSTFAGPENVEVGLFCQRIVEKIQANFKTPAETWPSLSAIGISWPGAVRDSHIVCPSGTLVRIISHGNKLGYNSPPADIHSFDLAGAFLLALRTYAKEKGFRLQYSLVCTVENDGNAEAFGNFCLRVMRDAGGLAARQQRHQVGTIVAKLGTSLAGGRISASGAVADDVSEFGRAVLNLNVPKAERPAGTARSLVSSLAVRDLSRTIEFGGSVLFGTREGKNDEDCILWRIEAVELGQLIPLWKIADPKEQFLKALLDTDNRPARAEFEKLQTELTRLLSHDQLRDELTRIIQLRGGQRPSKAPADCSHRTGKNLDSDQFQWISGLRRLHWLCNGQEVDYSLVHPGKIPSSFPYHDLARSVLGSVALFSQLGLQVAHLIALLYNVYRRGTFAEIILAGGVLAGDTGKLVRTQADAFFSKYYDKIKAHLPEDAITLADAGANPETVGPLGAAMVANRQHKLKALAVMRRLVEKLIRRKSPGGVITITEAEQFCRDVRVDPETIKDFLQTLVAQGDLVPIPDGSFRRL